MLFDIFGLFNLKFFIGFLKNGIFPSKLSPTEEDFFIGKLFDEEFHDEARTKLITHNLRLVAHIAKKYETKNDNLDDLISIGTLGLVKAVDTYSMDKNVKLATYSAKCIENEILMYLRSDKKNSKNVSLLETIGVDKDGSEISLIDVIPSSEKPIDAALDKKNNIEALNRYLRILDERELTIISLRYGLNGKADHTQKEISRMFNISRSYVSRIEKRALTKLLSEFKKNN